LPHLSAWRKKRKREKNREKEKIGASPEKWIWKGGVCKIRDQKKSLEGSRQGGGDR